MAEKGLLPLKVNSFILLQNWLKLDLLDNVNCLLPLAIIKKKLNKLKQMYEDNKFTDEIVKELFNKLLASDKNTIGFYLQELFLHCIFTQENYLASVNHFKNSDLKVTLDNRSKYNNRLQTLDYIVVLADDQRQLTQLERASLVTKAAIDLYDRFKNKNFTTHLNDKLFDTNAYKYFFGTSIRIYHPHNILCINQNSDYIVVLIGGQAYKISLITDDNPISAEQIYQQLESIYNDFLLTKNHYPAIGPVSTACHQYCIEFKNKMNEANQAAWLVIEKAIFIVCLDTDAYGENKIEQMFAHSFQNRYFGHTQFIFGLNCEAAVITSYLKIDGTPAVEIIDTIYRDSLKINLNHYHNETIKPQKINFKLNKNSVEKLKKDTQKIHHFNKSTYIISIGYKALKELDLNPNVLFNIAIVLAVIDITQKTPVLNQAISLRSYSDSSIQLDWLYITTTKLQQFKQAYENKQDPIILFKMLMDIIEEQKQRIKLSKTGLSPTFFIKKPDGIWYDELCDFYCYIGRFFPAYRNYLFRAYRNPCSVDIATSSLKLPTSIKTLGRHGTLSEVFTHFGVHIFIGEDTTELVFIPNKKWLNKIDQVCNKMNQWLNVISGIVNQSKEFMEL